MRPHEAAARRVQLLVDTVRRGGDVRREGQRAEAVVRGRGVLEDRERDRAGGHTEGGAAGDEGEVGREDAGGRVPVGVSDGGGSGGSERDAGRARRRLGNEEG